MRTLSFIWMAIMLSSMDAMSQPKPANGRVNENYVWLFHGRNKIEKLFPVGIVRTQKINRIVNISAECGSHDVIEVNHIPEWMMKDTVIEDADIDIILIQASGSWRNQLKKQTRIEIRCASHNPGSPLSIYVKTKIFRGKSSQKIELQLLGQVPEGQFIKTDTH